MRRNHGNPNRERGYYNVDLLNYHREKAGLSVRQVSLRARINGDSANRVFKGTASQKQTWPVSQFFNIDWKQLHDLELSTPEEFDRAVLNGNSKTARSSGPKRVGALRPAPVKRGGTYTREIR